MLNGSWKLTLANPNATPVDFHCWIERGKNTPWFLPSKTPDDGKVRASLDATLSIPGTASQVITRQPCLTHEPLRLLAVDRDRLFFQSGPRREGCRDQPETGHRRTGIRDHIRQGRCRQPAGSLLRLLPRCLLLSV